MNKRSKYVCMAMTVCAGFNDKPGWLASAVKHANYRSDAAGQCNKRYCPSVYSRSHSVGDFPTGETKSHKSELLLP